MQRRVPCGAQILEEALKTGFSLDSKAPEGNERQEVSFAACPSNKQGHLQAESQLNSTRASKVAWPNETFRLTFESRATVSHALLLRFLACA